MSKKRPGVAAAKRLSLSSDCMLWELVESQLQCATPVAVAQNGDAEFESLRSKFSGDTAKRFLTKDELLVVMQWKFRVGKRRPALLKHLHSNSEASVQTFSRAAIEKARDISSQRYSELDIKRALEPLTKLNGVGPATSSAVLSMIRPDIFCFMYDECIDTFLPKRTYTMPVYLAVNKQCTRLSESLAGWTPDRVARVLWIAARVSSSGKEDHTISEKDDDSKENTTNRKELSSRKRRRVL